MLSPPEGHDNFVVYHDTFGIGHGCVLMQSGRAIAYASPQLIIHEQIYLIHDLELTTVVLALPIQRHYRYAVSFLLFTNDKSLKYIFMQQDLNSKQCRWLQFLADFDIDITYHPGEANIVVWALQASGMGTKERMWQIDTFVAVLLMLTISSTIADHVGQAQVGDQLPEQ